MSLFIVFLLCLVLSAFFAASEMAFVSVNRLKLRQLADSGDPAASAVLSLYEKPQEFLTLLLIGNNIVNVAVAAIVTIQLDLRFGIANEWVVLALTAPVLLIFCETVPKDYARIRAQSFLLGYSGVMCGILRIFRLPVRMVLSVVHFFLRPLRATKPKNIFVNEEEFRSLIQESVKLGVISRPEKRLIDTILDFEKIKVEDVMVPFERIPKVSLGADIQSAKKVAKEHHSKMLLVYEELPEIIVGMIYVFDILFEEDETLGLKKFLRAPVFIPSQASIEKAFLTLQDKRQSYALITGKSMVVIGAVPIESLVAF